MRGDLCQTAAERVPEKMVLDERVRCGCQSVIKCYLDDRSPHNSPCRSKPGWFSAENAQALLSNRLIHKFWCHHPHTYLLTETYLSHCRFQRSAKSQRVETYWQKINEERQIDFGQNMLHALGALGSTFKMQARTLFTC